MSIMIGGQEPTAIKVGTQDVSAVYAGTEKVWPSDPLPAWLEYVNSITSDTKIGDSFCSVGWWQVTQLREYGNMFGSPRHPYSNCTGDSLYNRIIQHGVDSFEEFQWLMDNQSIPTLVYSASGGSAPYYAITFNNYQSFSYYSAYSGYKNFVIQWLTSDGTAYTRTKDGAATPLNYQAALLRQKIKDNRKKDRS